MAKLETLTEDWSSGSITGSGQFADNTSGHGSISSGQLAISTPSNSGFFYVISNSKFDLTGSYALCQFFASNVSSANIWPEVWPLMIQLDGNNIIVFLVSSGKLTARNIVDGSNNDIENGTDYDPDVHKWVRIRESGGTIFWDYSTDGTTWTNYASASNPFDVTSLNMQFAASSFSSGASSGTHTFDNLNLPPTVSTAGYVKVYDGSAFNKKPVKVWNGSSWVIKPVKYWNGSSWVETS